MLSVVAKSKVKCPGQRGHPVFSALSDSLLNIYNINSFKTLSYLYIMTYCSNFFLYCYIIIIFINKQIYFLFKISLPVYGLINSKIFIQQVINFYSRHRNIVMNKQTKHGVYRLVDLPGGDKASFLELSAFQSYQRKFSQI